MKKKLELFVVRPNNDREKTLKNFIAYLERPAGENNPQRWSQFPQYCLACNDEDQAPSFTYFSYGEGIVRISMQSKTDVRPMAEVLKGKKITASNLTQHDSVSVASDLIAFEKYGMKFNGFPENFDSAVLTAYNELKNNPSKVNDYYKLDRAS